MTTKYDKNKIVEQDNHSFDEASLKILLIIFLTIINWAIIFYVIFTKT